MSSDRRLSPALIQWILAAALLLFGLVSLPAFSGFLFILAAILAAPIRPLRDLLSGVGVKSWMIGALAVILAILGFVFFPARSSADADTDARAAVTSAATTTAKATTAKTTTAKETTTAKTTTAKATTTTKVTTTTPAATTTTTAAATTTTKATRAYHAPSNSPNVIEEGGTNQCYRNEIVTCRFWGVPNTEYNIDVYYSTKVSEAEGLENHKSDADGYVEWTWKIGGNTKEGRRYLKIIGGGETVKIEFDVLES